MATPIPDFLPQAPHLLWQTAASPFILPTSWGSMYPRCPRCGGNAPNICDEVWPDRWWEDDMLGLMYQGHIPPAQRTSPWDDYYAGSRVKYLHEVVPQTPLRIETQYYQPHEPHMAARAPITPPISPGAITQVPHWYTPRPVTPTSPTPSLPHPGQAFNSFDNPHGNPAHVVEFDEVENPRQRVARRLRRRLFF